MKIRSYAYTKLSAIRSLRLLALLLTPSDVIVNSRVKLCFNLVSPVSFKGDHIF